MSHREEVARLLAEMEKEHREVLDQLSVLTTRAKGLSSGISGLRTFLATLDGVTEAPHLEATGEERNDAPNDVEHPRGAEAVRRVLLEAGREMNIREITQELAARGWSPRSRNPENATSSNAARATEVFPDVARRRGENGLILYKYVAPDLSGVSNVTDMVRRVEAPLARQAREAIEVLQTAPIAEQAREAMAVLQAAPIAEQAKEALAMLQTAPIAEQAREAVALLQTAAIAEKAREALVRSSGTSGEDSER